MPSARPLVRIVPTGHVGGCCLPGFDASFADEMEMIAEDFIVATDERALGGAAGEDLDDADGARP